MVNHKVEFLFEIVFNRKPFIGISTLLLEQAIFNLALKYYKN